MLATNFALQGPVVPTIVLDKFLTYSVATPGPCGLILQLREKGIYILGCSSGVTWPPQWRQASPCWAFLVCSSICFSFSISSSFSRSIFSFSFSANSRFFFSFSSRALEKRRRNAYRTARCMEPRGVLWPESVSSHPLYIKQSLWSRTTLTFLHNLAITS